ncbi:pseudouridine synthase [Gongronella butleri]|nr:pseudouridine synthase [Gongronella butleri]
MLRSLLQRVFRPVATTTTGPRTKYDTWTRQQLVDRLQALETPIGGGGPSSSASVVRPINMTLYPQQRVALKVAYIGWRYFGFAALKDTDQTVEGQLFHALQKSQLIADPAACQFTRCGRTDRGVSGLGQVISLNLRQSKDASKPIPYLETLNRLLPPDIRVWAWASVHSDFNARFDCRSRTYKYFFKRQGMDVAAMQRAADLMVGSHDFRHFCKLDPGKQVSYERRVLSLTLQPSTLGDNHDGDAYEAVIKGSAFLWHQVRCIMSILFLVGQRLESPEIVTRLLDVSRLEGKPDYPLASDLPLVLYDCEYDTEPAWQYGLQPDRLEQHWHDASYDQWVRTQLYDTFASTISMHHQQQPLHRTAPHHTVILGGGKSIRTSRYRPLLDRPLADSEQVKRKKYNEKMKRKQDEQAKTA